MILRYRKARACNLEAVQEHVAPLSIGASELPLHHRIKAVKLALRTNLDVAGYIYGKHKNTIRDYCTEHAPRIPNKLELANRLPCEN